MQYDSFRLQVWRSIRLDRVQWAARLEDLKDGQSIQFAGFDALITHLRTRLDPEEIDDLATPPYSTGEIP